MKIEMPNAPHRAVSDTVEGQRLSQADRGTPWRKFGPYLSDRQWGTVREDYSPDGEAWSYLPHDQARSKAYRWGEDAIAGFSDDQLAICLGLALWNGKDPILKERLFGLTNSQGNHGEDVKELYYYVDGTPTHSYMRMVYKYPQGAFPYQDLLDTNARRSLTEREYELIDTGLFDHDRYFDVTVEYAKGAPEDVLMLITIANRGDQDAPLDVLPQLWSRNTWTWSGDAGLKPRLAADGQRAVTIAHPALPPMRLECDGFPELLFCDNETNLKRLYGVDATGYCKGRHQRLCRLGRHRRGEPGARRHQDGGALPRYSAGAWRDHAAPAPRPRRRAARPLRRFRFLSCRRAATRRMASTPRCRPAWTMPTPASCSARPSQACCGANNITASTSAPGSTATRPSRRRQRSARRAAMPTGCTSSPKISSRCRTPGNIPGSRPGISPSTA